VLVGDGGGERVGQLVDLFEEVGEDPLGLLAATDRGQLAGGSPAPPESGGLVDEGGDGFVFLAQARGPAER
jgi:hypothetical protein